MLNFNPDTPEPISANSLLSIIGDPKSAKKHIESVLKHQELLQKTTEELNAAKKAHDESKVNSEKSTQDHDSALERLQNFTANKEAELHNREAAVASKESELMQKIQSFSSFHSDTSRDITTRENNIVSRENAVTQKENDLRTLLDQAQKTKEMYEVKIANLRDALRVDYHMPADTGSIGASV